MNNKPFVIYKSSAGSGKTYTLTKEYLKLALINPIAFRGILAVTFTNKATREMKERILGQLNRLRREVKPDEQMDSELMEVLGCDEEELSQKAENTLSAILHDYGRFSVSTIDSFFQKILRSFAREMDLNAQFEVELDQDSVLSTTVDRVVEKVLLDADLHRWMVEYAIEQIQQGNTWDIRANILKLASEIFQEDFKKYGDEIRTFLEDLSALGQLQKYVRVERMAVISEAKQMKQKANEIRRAQGLEWSDFKGASKSFAQKFDKLGELANPIPELTPLQQELVNDPDGWYTKKSPHADAIIAAYGAGLGELLGQFSSLGYRWNTIRALGRNVYVFGLFGHIIKEMSVVKEEENMLLISDANEFLKKITSETDTPFIYEKVGNQFGHFLIDEFQDTSGFQWASFKPLLQNSLSMGKANLLVGDVKQSIYRWRGGDMRLMLEEVEADIGPQYTEEKNLETNFRSLPNIIHFNNKLFELLPEVLDTHLSNTFESNGGGILLRAYREVFQRIATRNASQESSGLVRLEILEEDKEEEDKHFVGQVLKKVPEMVIELQKRGYGLKDIAFLVRTKAEGEQIADCLMKHAQENPNTEFRFEVVSDESMFLTKSGAVLAIEAAMAYLLDPDDTLALATLSYYQSAMNDVEADHRLFLGAMTMSETRIGQILSDRDQWLSLPLLELVEELADVLELKGTGLEMAYIAAFKEALFDFVQSNRADLAGFMEWWEVQKEKRTVKIPDTHDAMKILTIHKSKGLEFKVVMMPFLKWRIFDTSKDNILWAPYSDERHGINAVLPLRLDKQLLHSEFEGLYRDEAVMAFLDSLNMLYVAFTRAEEVLWGLLPSTENFSGTSIQQFLQQLLTESLQIGSYDPETRVFQLGEWHKQTTQAAKSEPTVPLRWQYQSWKNLLRVRNLADDFSAVGLEKRKKREFGNLIHELLEKSSSKHDTLLHLEDFFFQGRLDAAEMRVVKDQLNKLFDLPRFASWFSEDVSAMVEQGILLPGGRQKRPDRIILSKEVVTVVDFKTGDARDYYAVQLQEYMVLVSEMIGLPCEGFICYLETGEIFEVG